MSIWEVEITVFGSVKVKDRQRFRTQKGHRVMNPFFSDISIRNFGEGLIITVTAKATSSQLANDAALVFVGQMLDYLVIDLGGEQQLKVSLHNGRTNYLTRENHIKRILTEEEIKQAFKESLSLSLKHPVFLKAYSWYRKGLYTEDPFDKFLAFFNSIELVASKYHPQNDAAKKGSKSQIWECFKAIWGECSEWPLYIRGNNKWIDKNYETRKEIAHGLAIVNIEEVGKVSSMITSIQNVAYLFLRDWKIKQLDQSIEHEVNKGSN